MKPKRMDPPPRRRGRRGGRRVSDDLVEAMRTVANNPDEWFLVAEYPARGTASGAANRMRQRDWDALLGIRRGNGKSWEITSRSYEPPKEGAGVWARRKTARRARAGV